MLDGLKSFMVGNDVPRQIAFIKFIFEYIKARRDDGLNMGQIEAEIIKNLQAQL